MELKIEDGFELINEVLYYYNVFMNKEFMPNYFANIEKCNEFRRSLIIVQLIDACPKDVLTEIYLFNQSFFAIEECPDMDLPE